jgi:uncharacterized protein
MKTIAFFPAHPSQIWIMDELYKVLKDKYHIIWFCRDKDILLDVAKLKGIKPIVLSTAKTKIIGNAFEFLVNIFKCFYYSYKYKIDLWVSKYGAAHISAYFMRKKSIAFTDDDVDIIPLTAWTSYPFTETILATKVTRQGNFSKKFKTINSVFELCYLHPNHFSADKKFLKLLSINDDQEYAIIRLSSLLAHHDGQIKGIDNQLLESIIQLLEKYHIMPLISSEKAIPKRFKAFLFTLPLDKMHHALYYAKLLIGDSQTMASESAVLGTAVFRFSDFTGRLSYIDDLESYGLIQSYQTSQGEKLLLDLEHFLQQKNIKKQYKQKQEVLLRDKEDPNTFFINEIENLLK